MVLDTEHKNREKLKQINYESTRPTDFADISAISGSKMLNPFEYLSSAEQNISLTDLSEAIIFWTQEQIGIEEIIQARQEFFTLTGRIFPDDYFYHQRISYFLDFFTFQRPIQGKLRENDQANTPFKQFVCSPYFNSQNISEALQKKFYDLANFRHSLFKVSKVKKNCLILKDLFANEKIEISDPHKKVLFQGLPPGSVYQGFIFTVDEKICLSQGLLLHPPSVSSFITRTVNKLKKNPPFNQMKYLAQLAKLNLNYIRHSKKDAKKIYVLPVE